MVLLGCYRYYVNEVISRYAVFLDMLNKCFMEQTSHGILGLEFKSLYSNIVYWEKEMKENKEPSDT